MVDAKQFLKDNNIKIVTNENKKNLIVLNLEGDVNDGDYVTEETEFSLELEDDVEALLTVLQVIRSYDEWDRFFCDDEYSYEEDDSLTNEEKELFEKFEETVSFPCDSWGRCHTITGCNFTFYDETGTIHELNIY